MIEKNKKIYFLSNRMTFFLGLIVCLQLFSCSDQTVDLNSFSPTHSLASTDIVGGHDMNYNSKLATTIVLISSQTESGQQQICTGTFISENYILTAAHCLAKNKDSMSISFRAKNYRKTEVMTFMPIEQIYRFNFPKIIIKRNDLALIKFQGGLPLGASAATLPKYDSLTSVKTAFVAVGYGKNTGIQSTDFMDSSGEGELRFKKMQATVINSSDETYRIDQHKNKGGVCFGDSGGPALVQDAKTKNLVVIGVASAIDSKRQLKGINNDDECKNESVYLNMLFYSKYIHKFLTLQDLKSKPLNL